MTKIEFLSGLTFTKWNNLEKLLGDYLYSNLKRLHFLLKVTCREYCISKKLQTYITNKIFIYIE